MSTKKKETWKETKKRHRITDEKEKEIWKDLNVFGQCPSCGFLYCKCGRGKRKGGLYEST